MATELSERERRFVLVQRVARLATVDATGEAYVVPICYAWDGARFYTPIDEKPKRGGILKRVRNIEASGRASLVIDRYDEDWSRLAWAMVRGEARIVQPGEPGHEAAVALLRGRYPQYWTMALERAPLIALTPTHVTSWGALDDASMDQPSAGSA